MENVAKEYVNSSAGEWNEKHKVAHIFMDMTIMICRVFLWGIKVNVNQIIGFLNNPGPEPANSQPIPSGCAEKFFFQICTVHGMYNFADSMLI